MKLKSILIASAFAVSAMAGASSASAACVGVCGTMGANGVVTAPPIGGPTYGYVTTAGGVTGAGETPLGGGTNGSQFTSALFAANSGDDLQFVFNYVTSDGAEFADYASAELETSTGAHVAWLFTARTTPVGNTSPGFGLEADDSTLTPATTPIIPGAPVWAPLGSFSGACFSTGCGYTGWIESNYTVAAAGTYQLVFGVSNYYDTEFDSGLAYAGANIGGATISTGVPEPASWALMIIGLFGLGAMARSQRRLALRA